MSAVTVWCYRSAAVIVSVIAIESAAAVPGASAALSDSAVVSAITWK